MPLGDEYARAARRATSPTSPTSAGRAGGAITAACFLRSFTEGSYTWAHLDIAGTAWQGGAQKGQHRPAGAMLLEYLLRRAAPR